MQFTQRKTRKDQKAHDRRKQALDKRFDALHQESETRSRRFWTDYERRNGPGSVDWN